MSAEEVEDSYITLLDFLSVSAASTFPLHPSDY